MSIAWCKTISSTWNCQRTTPDVVIAGPSGYVFTKQLMSKRDGTSLTTTVAIGKLPKNYDISGKSWSALVIDGARAIESPLAFK